MAFDSGKDFNGTALKLGDKVAFISPYIKSLAVGTVVGFTPKMIEVEWTPNRRWPPGPGSVKEKVLRNINWVTKVPETSVEDELR